MLFRILQFITAALLLWAVTKNPYDYYTLLRFIVCPVSAYAAYRLQCLRKPGWCWILGIIAVLFNPIFKVHLQRETWQLINVIVATVMVCAAIIIPIKNSSVKEAPDA